MPENWHVWLQRGWHNVSAGAAVVAVLWVALCDSVMCADGKLLIDMVGWDHHGAGRGTLVSRVMQACLRYQA